MPARKTRTAEPFSFDTLTAKPAEWQSKSGRKPVEIPETIMAMMLQSLVSETALTVTLPHDASEEFLRFLMLARKRVGCRLEKQTVESDESVTVTFRAREIKGRA